MSTIQSRLAWGGLFALLGVALVLSIGQAQPAEEVSVESLIPKDPVLFATWDGSDAHQAAWEQTAAHDAIYETGLINVFHKLVAFAGAQAEGVSEFAIIKDLVEKVGANGFTLAVSVKTDGPPKPQAIIVLHGAASMEEALANLIVEATAGDFEFETSTMKGYEVTRTLIPDSPGVEIAWWKAGKHLAISAGIDATADLLDVATGDAPNISENETYQQYRTGENGFEVASLGWFNFGSLRDQFGEMPLPMPIPSEEPLSVNRVLQSVGLESFDSVVFQTGYKGRSLWSENHVRTTGEKKGLMSLLDQKPITLDDLPPIPFSTNGFYACSLDWSQMYGTLTQTAMEVTKLGPPDAAAQVEGMMSQLPQMLGFDPKADLLDALGNVTCIYGDPRQGAFGLSFGVAISVKDPQKLRTTLNNILRMAVTMANPTEFSINSTSKHGREIITMQLGGGFVNPAIAVDDNWLIFGIMPQTVEAFLMRLDGKLTSWEPTASYKMAFDELPKEFTSIAVSDPRKTYRTMVGMAPMLMGFAQAGMAQSGMPMPMPISVADLPPAEAVSRPLFPNVSICTVDENGMHTTSRTSLPSFPSLGVSNSAAVPVLVALLLPAVQQARQAARRTQSANNLKQLGLAMHNYADVYNHFPQGTIPNEKLKPEERLSWIVSVLPFIEQNNLYDVIDQDKGWEDEVNADALKVQLPVLQNPGFGVDDEEFPPTQYVGISGWGKDSAMLPKGHERAGIFGYDRKTRFADILDGTSNTVAVSEASHSFDAWGAGGSGTVRGFENKPYINGPDGIGGPFAGGANMLLGDGSVRFISENIDPQIMERLAAMADGQAIGDF